MTTSLALMLATTVGEGNERLGQAPDVGAHSREEGRRKWCRVRAARSMAKAAGSAPAECDGWDRRKELGFESSSNFQP